MKHALILIWIFCVTANSSFAQPDFTSSDIPGIGDADTVNVLLYQLMPNDFDTETGTNYTWVISDLPFDILLNSYNSVEYRIPQEPQAINYPTAQMEEKVLGVSGSFLTYSRIDNDSLFTLAEGNSSSLTSFTPPVMEFSFPMSFGQTKTHEHIFTVNGTIVTGQRETTLTYDGWGTLTTYFGTQEDVFRIRRVERDSSYIINTMTEVVSYTWYKQGGEVPILTITEAGAPGYYFVFASRQNGLTNSIDELHASSLLTYPNPVTDQLNWSGDVEQIEIYSAAGHLVLSTRVSGNQIDVSQLHTGMYFMKAVHRNGRQSSSLFSKN